MLTVTEHIRKHLLDTAGVYERKVLPDLEDLRVSEWSPEFEGLMRNRMIMGAFRYGLLGDSKKPKYDRVSSAIKRLKEYQKSGNTESLVDAANICLLEFSEGNHPLKHFNSVDDGEHTPVLK